MDVHGTGFRIVAAADDEAVPPRMLGGPDADGHVRDAILRVTRAPGADDDPEAR